MRTERGLDRLVTFVDAIVAIAITLLVLPLVDLAVAGPGAAGATGHPLVAPIGRIGVFLLSFLVIARLWISHHTLFERVRAYDTVLVWWTLGWALTIVFLPFPTALVAERGDHDSVRALYMGTITLSSACLSAIAVLVHRRPELRGADRRRPFSPHGQVTSTATFAAASALGVAVHPIGYYALFLVLLTGWFSRLQERVRRRPGRRPSVGTPPGGSPRSGGGGS